MQCSKSDLEQYLMENRIYFEDRYLNNWVVCKDGFTFSVQGSSWHYSHPRNDGDSYTHYEVGYPSEEPQYIEMDDTVAPWVPVDVVLGEINFHGGLDV